MKTAFIPILTWGFLCFSLLPTLSAQTCGADAPQTYESVADGANPGQCFLIIDWITEMPAIECGSPGTPPAGSTVPSNRKLTNLSVIINSITYTLYDKSGGNCTGATTNVAYGTDPNTYITTISNTAFCDAGALLTVHVDGNQTGATVINCDMANAGAPVPIHLAGFSAKAHESINLLEWETSAEENTDYFEVERSMDGWSFGGLNKINAMGSSTGLNTYQWADETPLALAYYRLRIVDMDGNVDYSPVVAVERADGVDFNLSISPNPVEDDELRFSFSASEQEEVKILLLDIAGRTIHQSDWTAENGLNTVTLSLPETKGQFLILSLTSAQKAVVEKVWR